MVDVITVLLLAILAGRLGSLVGLGGSLITTPALVAVGVPVKYAIAAGMVTIIATSSGSASSYVREKIVNVKAAMFLEMFTIVGAIAGASVTSIVRSEERRVGKAMRATRGPVTLSAYVQWHIA